MEVKVLGTGCTKCKSLEKMTNEALTELGIEATVTKEEDIMKIMAYGILSTPGLVVDEKLVMSGRLPTKNEIKSLLTQ